MELLRNHYSKLVLLHNEKIDEIKSQNAVSTFYENKESMWTQKKIHLLILAMI
jgi:hypothetical protein